MTTDPASLARTWARELPRPSARQLAIALRKGPHAVKALRSTLVLSASIAAATAALDIAEKGDGPFAAGLLTGRLDALAEQPSMTPVWTGPESGVARSRLTLAVLSDLIGEAENEILLVSYATIPSSDVVSALTAAADRGVEITTLLERHTDNPQFHGHGDPFPDLHARRLCWPAAERPAGASMHAKVLVIDRRIALIGSANLTGYGLERNLECGLLIRDRRIPEAITKHLLSAQGVQDA